MKGMTMPGYIVCEKKGNFPRIHVKICQQRCEHTDTCEAFQEFLKTHVTTNIAVAAAGTELPPEKGLSTPAL
jgi:hypothetical protein